MIRNDARSKLPTGPPRAGAGPHQPFSAPSRVYRAMPVYPGALAAFLERTKRPGPAETTVREQLRVSVWEAEGGSLPPVRR